MSDRFSGKRRERRVFQQYLLRSLFFRQLLLLDSTRKVCRRKEESGPGSASVLMSCKGPAGGEFASEVFIYLSSQCADVDMVHSTPVPQVLYSKQL